VFSFDARKILTTGEGGVITTEDDAAADHLRALRAHSASVSMLARHTSTSVVLERYPEVGYNYKMTDIQGAMGIVQIGRVNEIVAERQRLARRYDEMLGGDARLEIPFVPPGHDHVYQSYCVRLHTRKTQGQVMDDIARRDVATRRIIACHLEARYRSMYPGLCLPETEAATSRTLLLPMFVGLTDEEQVQVTKAVLGALGETDVNAMVPETRQFSPVGI